MEGVGILSQGLFQVSRPTIYRELRPRAMYLINLCYVE